MTRFIRKKIKAQKGSIMIETVGACILLIVIMMACIEIFSLVSTRIYMEKVVREGAREASILGDINAGTRKAQDVARQYLPGKYPAIELNVNKVNGKDANVSCFISVDYRFLQHLNNKGVGEEDLDAEAIYPWYDEN